MNNFKPQQYNSVSPYFMVSDARRMIELLTEIFDATPLRRYERPDGTIMHVEVRIDDSVIMLSDATPGYPANVYWLHVYVPDVDMVFQRAIAVGCEGIETPVQKENDIDRRGTFKDPFGNMWSIATQQNQTDV